MKKEMEAEVGKKGESGNEEIWKGRKEAILRINKRRKNKRQEDNEDEIGDTKRKE